MRFSALRPLVLLSCSGLAACSGAPSDATAGDEAASELGSRVGVDQLSTFEPAIALLDGYEATLDDRLVRCVEPAAERAPLVGQVTQETRSLSPSRRTRRARRRSTSMRRRHGPRDCASRRPARSS